MKLTITKADQLKAKPDDSKLSFGTIFTDYMFNMDYNPQDGWHNPRIEPYASIRHGSGNHGASLWSGCF